MSLRNQNRPTPVRTLAVAISVAALFAVALMLPLLWEEEESLSLTGVVFLHEQGEPGYHRQLDPTSVEQKKVELGALAGSKDGDLDAGPVGVCSRYSIDMLTSAMSTDRENALRPMSIQSNSKHEEEIIHFDGMGASLVNRTFLNNARIAMVGDSTLAHFRPWFVTLLLFVQATGQSPYSMTVPEMGGGMTASTARAAIMKFGGIKVQRFGFVRKFKKGRSAHDVGPSLTGPITPMGGDGAIFFNRISTSLGNAVDNLVDFKPDIIIANVGLHLLHLQNFGREVDNIVPWLGYEDTLENMVEAAEAAGAEVLLLKTTNFVCPMKYSGSWLRGSMLYAKDDMETLNNCFMSYRKTFPTTVVGDADIMDYCKYGVIDNRGSNRLNQRLYRFVENARGRHPSLKMAVYNDHDLQSCETTVAKDGRHHHPINLARARLLGNYLDCLYGWDGLHKKVELDIS